MEELVALIIQVVVEVGLQLFGAVGIDWATGASDKKGDKEEAGCGWLFIFALLGAACGGLSLVLVPKLVLPTLGLRIANLVVAPLAAGGLSYLVARLRYAVPQWRSQLKTALARARTRLQHADVDGDRFTTSYSLYLLVLKHSQQSDLSFERQFAYLVQEDRTAIRGFETTETPLGGAGEGTLFVAKQF